MRDVDAAATGSLPPPLLRPPERGLAITSKGLVLGRTVLAKMAIGRGGSRELILKGQEERILALLAVVFGEAVDFRVLESVRRASNYWSSGEAVLAAIALARTGLPLLDDPERAAKGLFAAEQLLDDGLSPCELIKACDLDPTLLDLRKAGYNPDQPRLPAGNPDGGQWTNDGASGNSSTKPAGGRPPTATADADTGPGYGSSLPPHGEPPSAAGGANESIDHGSLALPRAQPSSAAGGTSARPSTTLHGYATVYSQSLSGRPTATGDAYDPTKMTAAVLPGTIPLKSIVTVTLDNDPRRKVEVYVNDHGLYQRIPNPDGTFTNRPLPGRVIDLSGAAFKALTGMGSGKVMVTVTVQSGRRR